MGWMCAGAIKGLIALGVTMVLICGKIDLSTGSQVGLSGMFVAVFCKNMVAAGYNQTLACLIGMAVGTVGERIYQAKLLIETADLLAWTVLVVAASWACERVLVWLLRVSGPVAWRAAVRAHGHGLRGRAGGSAGGGAAAELALAVGDRAPWSPALDGLVLHVPAAPV